MLTRRATGCGLVGGLLLGGVLSGCGPLARAPQPEPPTQPPCQAALPADWETKARQAKLVDSKMEARQPHVADDGTVIARVALEDIASVIVRYPVNGQPARLLDVADGQQVHLTQTATFERGYVWMLARVPDRGVTTWELYRAGAADTKAQKIASGTSPVTPYLEDSLYGHAGAVYWVSDVSPGKYALTRFDVKAKKASVVYSGGVFAAIAYDGGRAVIAERDGDGLQPGTNLRVVDLATGKVSDPPAVLSAEPYVNALAISGDTYAWSGAPGTLWVWKTGWEKARRVIDGGIGQTFPRIDFAGDFIIASDGYVPWAVDQRNWSATKMDTVVSARGFGHKYIAVETDKQADGWKPQILDTSTLSPLPGC